MAKKDERPGVSTLGIQLNTGQIVNRQAPIRWLSPSIGYADIPTLVVGETIRVFCLWAGGKFMQTPVGGPPLSVAVDALLFLAIDTGRALSQVKDRILRLEGKAAGDVAEEAANAPEPPVSRAEAEQVADEAMRKASYPGPRLLGADGEPA